MRCLLIIITICLLQIVDSRATHIRAGEITATYLGSEGLQYSIRITGYRDVEGDPKFGELGFFHFGHGDEFVPIDVTTATVKSISDETEMVYYDVVHVFPSVGLYTISYTEQNRNAEVKNMDNSIQTPFHVETTILINGSVGLNATPVFLVPPVDKGAIGVAFIHNPGAFDADGDSLSYEMKIPKKGEGVLVDGYRSPADPFFYSDYLNGNETQDGIPEISIHPETGTLTWDAPGTVGEYNIAFVVKEWRFLFGQWNNIGTVTRDMQIIIEDSDNNRPELEIPPDICVEAKTKISETITASDPDGDDVIVEGFGGPFTFFSDPAYLLMNDEGSYQFEWQTQFKDVRKNPYEIQFKVTDIPAPGPPLVDFKIWNITVVAPAPEDLSLAPSGTNDLELTWKKYAYTAPDSIQVWKRTGSFDFTPSDCVLGIPESAGYYLIATLSNTLPNSSPVDYVSSYIDEGVADGTEHCYRLVAIFNEPGGGISYASEEVCEVTEIEVPIILNVDVRNTDTENGEMYVRWMAPIIEDALLKPPYTYNVTRYNGLSGTSDGVEIANGLTNIEYLDTGLATEINAYNYVINALNADGISIGSSHSASSVWLQTSSDLTKITLKWGVGPTQWSIINSDFPYHYIYRDHVANSGAGNLVLIDSVRVDQVGLVYVDNGSFNGESLSDQIEYTYQIETQGSYSHEDVEEPLFNTSQRSTARINDEISPCAPISLEFENPLVCEEFILDKSCQFNDFYHDLRWSFNVADSCDNDIKYVEIQYSPSGKEEDFKDLEERIAGNTFRHEGLSSYKGCYRIRSWDSSGNASLAFSEILCSDNCPNFQLPNAFSPNNDGHNDYFTSFDDEERCPRFVEEVHFKVFDRSGGVLYDSREVTRLGEQRSMSEVNWDGKTTQGKELEEGVYFYGAEVTFDVLNEDEKVKSYKGWVQLLR